MRDTRYSGVKATNWSLAIICGVAVFMYSAASPVDPNGPEPLPAPAALLVGVIAGIGVFILSDTIFTLLLPKYRQYKKDLKNFKKEEKEAKRALRAAKNQPDSEIVKIEMIGTNQAFQSSAIFTNVIYNETEYTVKVTFRDGATAVRKVKGSWLNRYSDLLV